jgi:hypothetical protein
VTLTLRAALVPLGSLDRLEGVGETLSARALAVSFAERGASHLFVMADALPSAFAASVVKAGGRVLYGLPDSRCFSEGVEEPPPPSEDGVSFRLGGHPQPFVVRGAFEPMERFLDVRWTPATRDLERPVLAGTPIRLRPTTESRPVMGVILSSRDVSILEEQLYSLPESRFQAVSFAASKAEVVLRSTAPGSLEGVAGGAFHRQPLEEGKDLYLPLGSVLDPEFAAAWLARLLGKEGDHFFWRDGVVMSLRASDFSPLTRRSWHEALRDDP